MLPVSPSQIVHVACGATEPQDCVDAPGECWLCGAAMQRGQRVADWAGASFTGQTRVKRPDATHVCSACVFVCSRVSAVPGRPPKEGKSLGGNFRNYSHLWDEHGYTNASKGEKPKIREFLSRFHVGAWFAAIADSGQKHVLPWTPINPAGTRRGVVLFDEQIVTLPQVAGWSIVSHMTDLLTAGATKEEIERGDYSARAWQLCGDGLRSFEEHWGDKRRSAWFGLALWLSQRDEAEVQIRLQAEKATKDARRSKGRKAENVDGRSTSSRARGVPRERHAERAEALGDSAKPDARSDAHNGHAGAVDHEPVSRDADPGTEQLDLFGRG